MVKVFGVGFRAPEAEVTDFEVGPDCIENVSGMLIRRGEEMTYSDNCCRFHRCCQTGTSFRCLWAGTADFP